MSEVRRRRLTMSSGCEDGYVRLFVTSCVILLSFSLIMMGVQILSRHYDNSHSPKSNKTLPNIAFNRDRHLFKEFNISTWDLPSSPYNCVQMALSTGNYPTFIDEEYRCYKKNDSCSDSGNVLECWSFLISPRAYLKKYFNKTLRRPKSKAECSLREYVRMMDFSNESWFHTLPKEKQGHKMYQCKEYFKRILDQKQDTTTSTPPLFVQEHVFWDFGLPAILGILAPFAVLVLMYQLNKKQLCCYSHISPVGESLEVSQDTHQERNLATRGTSTSSSSSPTEAIPKTLSQESPPSYDQATSLPSYQEAIHVLQV